MQLTILTVINNALLVHIFPNVTKYRKGGHCTVILSCDIMCFTTWLQLAVESSVDLKQPIINCIVE